ncbi:VOC family protein [uncultured Roseobacter sp.]|uniref:VOC family protein n=1 Tax=uncultured Roseobacter sp. TaxID=114847 RepID=UPI0026089001|nr:VOC family protein [uncultured Roseobacter sp.]
MTLLQGHLAFLGDTMINGGNASIYVKNMDKSVIFYTEVLGLRLRNRVGETWAELDAGSGLTLGLHPANPPKTVAAGAVGAINVELRVSEPLEAVVQTLSARGVTFNGPILEYDAVRIASMNDLDQNIILLAQVLIE